MVNSLRLLGYDQRVTVLDRGLSKHQQDLLAAECDLVVVPHTYASNPTLFKPFAHLTHPHGVIILLDSDLIVARTLDLIIEAAISGQVCACADPESERWFAEWERIFDLPCRPRRQTYINAGFLAFSVEHWPHLLPRWWSLCQRISSHPTIYEGAVWESPTSQADQDVLNAILMSEVPAECITVLPQETQPTVTETLEGEVELLDLEELSCSLRGRPVTLVHITGKTKPWELRGWSWIGRHLYPTFLRRLLIGEGVRIQVSHSDVPVWFRRGNIGRLTMQALSSVNRLTFRVRKWPALRLAYELLSTRSKTLHDQASASIMVRSPAPEVMDRSDEHPESMILRAPSPISEENQHGKDVELPGFSLVLGTIGRTEELRVILNSLDAQTYRNFELILVDQNQDERLTPILAPYADKFPLVHVRTEKKGLSRAKNLGLELASKAIIGFPDDNCQYPAHFLQRVAQFLARNPEWDGMTGRSIDEQGGDSYLKFDRKAGALTKYNAWKRGAAYSIFVRADRTLGVRFDEEMGPGAGTPSGAGDETDYLLQLIERGASLFYDPDLFAIHPEPITPDNEDALHRAYSYAWGGSHAVKKHRFPLWFQAWWILRSVLKLLVSLIGREKVPGPQFRWNLLKGKVRGLVNQN
jgi:glycosyltransferase involved in cell wall biosynthesis